MNQAGFDTNDWWALAPQIVSVVALVWFGFQSFLVFYRETKTTHAKSQGAVPALEFLYMIVSVYYIFRFILNFGELKRINHFKLLNALDSCDDTYWYVLFIKILTALILVAFTLNFSKALLTLTSLEFGILSNQKMGDFFTGTLKRDKIKPYAETLLRLLIAALFILIEKKLDTPEGEIGKTIDPNVPNYTANSFLQYIGWLSLFLYTFLLSWLALFYCWLDKNGDRKLSGIWYKNCLKQFLAGIVVALFLLLFGWNVNGEGYKIILTVFFFVGAGAAITIILAVILNEGRRLVA